jgi:AraC family transcriptional regulator
MDVSIVTRPKIRLATVHHVGPYPEISEAFGRLAASAGPAGLLRPPGADMIAIYHDDPETTPAQNLQSDAGVTVEEEVVLPAGLREMYLPAGPYARTTHVGPYDELPDAWARFMGRWLPSSGRRVGPGPSFELYRNTPMDTAPSALVTELYLSLD